ncbi:unnamed protein product, partial [Effrenium voratum]
ELLERRGADSAARIEALRASEAEQQQQLERLQRTATELAEARKGLTVEVEKCQSAERQLEESVRRVDARVERLSVANAQCTEGVAEAKAFARQATENVASQGRELLEQRASELKARHETATEELRSLRLAQEEAQRQAQAGLATSRADAGERESRLSSRLAVQAQEAQDLRGALEEQLKRQESPWRSSCGKRRRSFTRRSPR